MTAEDIGYRTCDGKARRTLSGLLAHVTHDLSNLLTPVVAYPQLIASELPESGLGHELLDEVLKSAREMTRLVTQLRYLATNGDLHREPLDANEVVSAVETTLMETYEGKGISMQSERTGTPVFVDGDVNLILVAYEHLVRNGCEAAMRGGSGVKLAVACLELPAGTRSDGALSPSGEFVELSVEDDGPGIAADIRADILEPFVTTKPRSEVRGAGLGLTIAHRVACDHGGRLVIERTADSKTRVALQLPLSSAQP